MFRKYLCLYLKEDIFEIAEISFPDKKRNSNLFDKHKDDKKKVLKIRPKNHKTNNFSF